MTTPSRPAGYYGGPNEIHAPLQENPYSWVKVSDVMYVEQPINVGFSYGPKEHEPQTETDVARDFYGFLQNFLDVFPAMRTKRLFLVGESYAGMYTPAIAHYIYEANQKLSPHSKRHINVAGIALGNGQTDATIQSDIVVDYAWWHGMIDSVTRDALHEEWKNCFSKDATLEDLGKKQQPNGFHSFTVPDDCGIMPATMRAAGAELFDFMSPNVYDVTTWDMYNLITAANSTIESFFNEPRVRKALHAPEIVKYWRGCIPGAGRRRNRRNLFESWSQGLHQSNQRRLHLLDNDRPVSMANWIADLLDKAGISVLVYNGDRDLSVCAQGSELVLNGMKWSGNDDWLNPRKYERGLWMVNDYPAGYSKTVRNLNFLVVYNSGHMVPTNVPASAFDLITRFLNNTSFIDHVIPPVYINPNTGKINGSKNTKVSSGAMEHHYDHRSVLAYILLAFVAGVVVSQLISRHMNKKRYGYESVVQSVTV